jgi:hypothetical protein
MNKTFLRMGVAHVSVVLLSGGATAATPIKIIDTKADESHPSVADGWEAWSANTQAHRKALHGHVRPTGGSITRIPSKGHVEIGNIITDGPHAGQVVFRTDAGGDYNIRFYDLATGEVSKPPSEVNTTKYEEDPSVSGDYLSFTRYARGSWNVWLYRFSTDSLVKVAAGINFHPQVNGDFVAFSHCKSYKVGSCKVVYRYKISTERLKKMPDPAKSGRANYYAAVGSDGTMYWVEGGAIKCGAKTKIRRWQAGTLSTLWTAPDGLEIAHLQADTLVGTSTLAFTRYVCSTTRTGVYGVAA